MKTLLLSLVLLTSCQHSQKINVSTYEFCHPRLTKTYCYSYINGKLKLEWTSQPVVPKPPRDPLGYNITNEVKVIQSNCKVMIYELKWARAEKGGGK